MSNIACADDFLAKSDQINAVDLTENPIIVTIKRVVRKNSKEQPWDIYLEGFDVPYRPNKTYRRALRDGWGTDLDLYVGRSISIFNDKTVKWKGKEFGGIRIHGISGIERPFQIAQKEGGVMKYLTIVPIGSVVSHSSVKQKPEYPAEKFAENLSAWVKAITEKKITIEAVAARCNIDFVFTDRQIDALKEAVISASQSGQQQPQTDSIQEF